MRLTHFVIAAAFLAAGLSAQADSVSPATSSLADATLLAQMSDTAGSGTTYTEYVYKDPNNTVCVGCLDFVLVINGADTEKGKEVDSITTGSFKNYDVAVAYEDDGNVIPSSTSATNKNNKITIDFDGLYNGDTSDPVILYTNALNFNGSGSISFDINKVETDPAAYQPIAGTYVAPTPEPSSIALLGTGMLGFAGVIRRRMLRS